MKVIGVSGACLLALLACACTTSRPITLPSGEQGRLIGCGGIQHSFADCYVKAGEICPHGYDVLLQNGEAQPFAVSSGGFSASPAAASGGYSAFSGSSVQRTLMVQCH